MRNDDGYATVLAAGIIAAIVGLVCLSVVAVTAVFEDHRAQVAADLAAVAGAHDVYLGRPGCAVATRVAHDNGATLVDCAEIGRDVRVTVKNGSRERTALAGPTH